MKITKVDDGIYLSSDDETHNIQFIRVDTTHSGDVTISVGLGPLYRDKIDEILQYLTPLEAMALSKALERCAYAALKEGA